MTSLTSFLVLLSTCFEVFFHNKNIKLVEDQGVPQSCFLKRVFAAQNVKIPVEKIAYNTHFNTNFVCSSKVKMDTLATTGYLKIQYTPSR